MIDSLSQPYGSLLILGNNFIIVPDMVWCYNNIYNFCLHRRERKESYEK